MADDALATNATLERPSDNGQVERASEAQAQSGTGGSASTNGQPTQTDENIKNLQRKLSEKDLQAKQALAEAQQAKNLVQQLQQQLREMQKSSAPDDYSKLELELQWAKQEAAQYAQAYQQAMEAQRAEQARAAALREVAEEFGVSVKDLEEATDYMSAVKLAVKAQREREQRKQQEADDKRERNMPDVGSGAPRTTQSEWDAAWAEAQKNRDSVAMARLLRTRPKGAG